MRQNLRFWLVIGGLVLATVGLIWRMVDLMVVNRTFLQGQGDARSVRVISIPAYRGMITDRNGKPLAVSTPVDSVWIDPSDFHPKQSEVAKLAELLAKPSQTILNQAQHSRSKEFAYLKRGLNPFYANKIKALNIAGVYIQREFRRYYPEGEVTAQLVGFTNVDDNGQEGEELAYNSWLQGIAGKKRIVKDRLGHIIADVELIRAPQPGRPLMLSIDRRIQYLAYRELKEAIQRFKAQSGSVVVLDTVTGEVLAMVNQPSYNPNNRPVITDGRIRNRAVTDVFEPGSTIKSFSVATALASGKYQPSTIIDTRPGFMKVENKTVRDIHNYGVLDVTGVLKKSSNVGVTKMILSLPPNQLWQLLSNVGFGQITNVAFPGESGGILVKPIVWRPFELATLSFGYGLNVTNLQLAQAYSVFANAGVKRPLSLIRTDRSEKTEEVQAMKPEIANQILGMMETVVDEGAIRAVVPGYRVSGKTGTIRNLGVNGYDKDSHSSLFVGIAPVSKPRLVISVMIKEPASGGYYGAVVAAPVFAKIMGSALRILNAAPDKAWTNEASEQKING